MKKWSILFIILFFMVIGFAAVNTVLDYEGLVEIAKKVEDFKIVITDLVVDDIDVLGNIDINEKEFSFEGKNIEYTISNDSTLYDAEVYLKCIILEEELLYHVGVIPAQEMLTKSFSLTEKQVGNCMIETTGIDRTSVVLDSCEFNIGDSFEFAYTGNEQKIFVPCNGEYKLETWGAEGGSSLKSSNYSGGYGAYAVGEIALIRNRPLFIYVGGEGKKVIVPNSTVEGGYNGGGFGQTLPTSGPGASASDTSAGSGGGATHIASYPGLLSSLSEKVENVFIVSGGGGGGSYVNSGSGGGNYGGGGHAGGIKGGNTRNYGEHTILYNRYGIGGDQTGEAGTGSSYVIFGKAGIGAFKESGGGGGGYYGGLAGGLCGGGGGSSYIGNPLLTNKVMYCYQCITSKEESTKTISTNNVSAKPIANSAKSGAGYAKITLIRLMNQKEN